MTRTPLETLGDLEATLAALSDALAARNLEAILDIEPRLALAAEAVARIPESAWDDREALRRAVQGAVAALTRCEQLGRAAAELSRDMVACATQPGYERTGLVETPAAGRALDTRL